MNYELDFLQCALIEDGISCPQRLTLHFFQCSWKYRTILIRILCFEPSKRFSILPKNFLLNMAKIVKIFQFFILKYPLITRSVED